MPAPNPPPPLPNAPPRRPLAAEGIEAPDPGALAEEKVRQSAELVMVLSDAVRELEAKYLRVAYQIGRGMTGRAGSFDDIPEIDDMVRARSNLDHMAAALERADIALTRLSEGR